MIQEVETIRLVGKFQILFRVIVLQHCRANLSPPILPNFFLLVGLFVYRPMQ